MTGASLGKTLGSWGGKYAGPPTTGWQSVGGTGPAFTAGWANFGSTDEVGAVRKSGPLVEVVGSVVRSSGASFTPFVLAAGMRPNRIVTRPCSINLVPATLQVDTSGNVTLVYALTPLTNGQMVSFSFRFATDQL